MVTSRKKNTATQEIGSQEIDARMMQLAIAQARLGAGHVQTNPMVGAVIAIGDKVLTKSYHARFGGPHAERRALDRAMKHYSKAQLKKATLYMTLEPCSRRGKTMPCVPLVMESGIGRIVIGTRDPNPGEQGNSIRMLRKAKRQVSIGVEQEACDYLIRTFRKWITTKQPFILGKVGMTLDSKLTRSKSSYITNASSRARVHELRQEFDAILVGVNTILHDDPLLTTRLDASLTGQPKETSHPIKIILDSRLRTPASSKALDENTIVVCLEGAELRRKKAIARTRAEILEIPPIERRGQQLFEQMDMNVLLRELGRRQISSLLIEGGSYVFTTFINERAIDEFYLFIAPYLLGATSLPFTHALKYTVSLQPIEMEVMPATAAERKKGEDDNILMRGFTHYEKS